MGLDPQVSTPLIPIGLYPTPVFEAKGLSTPNGQLWVKNDGMTHSLYGGNKVRKLERLIARARERGARRLVTVGAAGSHHVLATTVFGRMFGLRTAAVLVPQPWTSHAEEVLRCSLGQGLEAWGVARTAAIALALARLLGPRDYFIPHGGWGPAGSLGYVGAVSELLDQIRSGEVPEPDLIVTALGSGGTTAGLLAGILREGLDTRVLAVSVFLSQPWLARAVVVPLAARLLRQMGLPSRWAGRRLIVSTHQLGGGYGVPTPEGGTATALAALLGLRLDPTYTAKAFAAGLQVLGCPDLVGRQADRTNEVLGRSIQKRNQPLRVLYWHTLSSASCEPLLAQAPSANELPNRLRRLLKSL